MTFAPWRAAPVTTEDEPLAISYAGHLHIEIIRIVLVVLVHSLDIGPAEGVAGDLCLGWWLDSGWRRATLMA